MGTGASARTVVFTRKATGLVKSANRLEATIWNIVGIMGSKFPWSIARLGLFPAALVLGWSPYLWALLLVGLASYVLGIIYVQIASAIPRSGADYVIPSRLMGPFWGWIQSWTAICAFVPLWGWTGWVTIRNIKQLVDILRLGGLVTFNIPWILSGTPALLAGIIVILIGMSVCFLPAKRYYQSVAAIGIIAIFSLVVMGIGAAVLSQSAFTTNLESMLGFSRNQLLENAAKEGFNPNQGLDFASTATLAGLVLYGVTGFQNSATISGELKGKIQNSLLVSILGSLTLFLAFFIPLVWLFLTKFDYNTVLAWSYLFWNNPADAPLRLPPINALLLTVAIPNMALVWAVAGFAAIVGGWLVLPANLLYTNRMVLYWGIDRIIPERLSEVTPKFRQPLKLFAIQGILAVMFFGLTLLGVNPITYVWWAVLLWAPAFVFPGICALLLPRRHPELMRYVPWRRWLAPLAVLWLIIIVPFYVFAGFIGSVPALTPSTSLWQYATSTGLGATLFAVVAGIVIYVLARVYNLRRGIDTSLIYRQIPPE